jgi:soluble cytochrome b562
MQSRLSFSRITPSQAAEQNSLIASQASAQHVLRQTEQKRAALLKRRPGRPVKVLGADQVLTGAAAALASDAQSDAPPAKRGKYNNWLVTHAAQQPQ